MSSFFRFVIMGPPGSGKGTISSRIVKNFNFLYLSSGDALRDQISKESIEGQKAKTYIEKGQLVPDDLVTNLVLSHLETLQNSSWLLDGFPRTVKQAEDLARAHQISMAINLSVPEEIIVSRLKGRWVHISSGRIYNTDFNPPKIPGKDDLTGEELVQREDDKPEIVMSRLMSYKRINSPILEYYRKKNILKEFAGKESNEIWPHVKQCIENYIKS